MIDYAIVVATRNRIEALRVSIPLFLRQTRLPRRILIVDSSDDHAEVRSLCAEISGTSPVPIEVFQSDRANSAYQRNFGLDRVTEEIIIYPDDDSFWYPDTAERMLAVYERDTRGLIGGVTGIETGTSPVASRVDVPKKTKRLIQKPNISRYRDRIEKLFFPQPFNVYGQDRIAALGPAAGPGEIFVETMGGYRMSFRTEVIRPLRFDDALGANVGYAVHEDKDLSLRVLRAGCLLAAAPGARVFHNVHPGKRAKGFAYGFCHLMNYIYISRKVFEENSIAMRSVKPYCRYKIFLYSLKKSNEYDKDIYLGAKAAMDNYNLVMSAPLDKVSEVYSNICREKLS